MWYCNLRSKEDLVSKAMETEETLKRFSAEGPVVKVEDNRVESDGEDVGKVGNRRVHEDEDNTFKGLSPSIIQQEDQLESAKAKMCAAREENERLKTQLDRAVKEYKSLEMHFFRIVQQEQKTIPSSTTSTLDQVEETRDLVLLSLGRSSSTDIVKEEKRSNLSKSKENVDLKEGLALGLVSKFKAANSCGTQTSSSQILEKRFNDSKEEETKLSKILKPIGSKEDEVPQQTHSEKTRVSVRARCDAPTMNDGCQWRKYGQKISKGNPCPRGYYRCTVGPTCPVKKKVQRCAADMSILITTYEGTHNHPLPMSATAMASTTSAAASMQMSGSTSSCPEPRALTGNTSANLHSLNSNLSNNYSSRQFYTPSSSFSSLSSRPTITLDLTVPPPSSSLYAPSHFNRCTPTTLNFSSLDTNVPTSWNNLYSSYGKQNQQYIPCMANSNQPPTQQSVSTEAIAAATSAITSDPSFRTALEAAITSIVGGGVDRPNGPNIDKVLKWGESFPVSSVYSSSNMNWDGWSSSYLDNTSSSSSKHKEGRLMFRPPPSLPFSSNTRASEAPVAGNLKKEALL